ncbi:MAG: glycoside hydrolase family 88 protein [Bacteroidales bacterium]|nr:glycoside hydrolase family 88 protein [Bacteroidales bacterium]
MVKKIFHLVLLATISFARWASAQDKTTSDIFALSEQQLKGMVAFLGDTNLSPRCTNHDGSIRLVRPNDWTSGFFPGCLWYQYEYSNDPYWRVQAEKHTRYIVREQFNGKTHDMGFKMYCSFGNGYRLTNNKEYKEILLQSAKTLITRYNPKVGCLRSWDHNADKWQFPVIIDNMMNLELLFWATRETGDSTYYRIAYNHALTTLKNHFRADFSSYHVIGYDTATGNVLQKHTHQGLHHESAWARGQAWGLYGFTMAFRETGDESFLEMATNIARYIINHQRLPVDGVPYWDFDDPSIPNAPRDASAAAVICSALFELSGYIENEKESFLKFAEKVFLSLSSAEYLAVQGTNNYFILKHSTGHMPKNDEIDVPIIYADYYFLEAALRREKK